MKALMVKRQELIIELKDEVVEDEI